MISSSREKQLVACRIDGKVIESAFNSGQWDGPGECKGRRLLCVN
jgi:hypothetical protein